MKPTRRDMGCLPAMFSFKNKLQDNPMRGIFAPAHGIVETSVFPAVRSAPDHVLVLCIVMGTIMLDHKIGGMLDHDLIEENL